VSKQRSRLIDIRLTLNGRSKPDTAELDWTLDDFVSRFVWRTVDATPAACHSPAVTVPRVEIAAALISKFPHWDARRSERPALDAPIRREKYVIEKQRFLIGISQSSMPYARRSINPSPIFCLRDRSQKPAEVKVWVRLAECERKREAECQHIVADAIMDSNFDQLLYSTDKWQLVFLSRSV
jgi:hypothetical protein